MTLSDGHLDQSASSKTPAKPRFFKSAMDDLDVPPQLRLRAAKIAQNISKLNSLMFVAHKMDELTRKYYRTAL